jgi:KDO2-lipid IV(A) lauroyltransferase
VKSNINRRLRWKQFRHRLEAAAVHALAWVIPRCSRPLVQRVGHGIGWLGYYFLGDQRRIALANLDVAFGEAKTPAEKRRIARASFQNFAATVLCHFWAPRISRETLGAISDIDPAIQESLLQIHARGKGIIFVTLHHADWELLGLATSWYSVPMTVVSRTMRNPAVEAVFRRLREQSGNQIISSHRAAPALLKTLKQGGSVALLIDQQVPPSLGGVWVDFFGLPALTTSAVARLALRSGAAIVGAAGYPLSDGRQRAVYEEIPFESTDNADADVHLISQRCLDFCERVVREHPEYWLWSYKRWKHRPVDVTGRFPFYTRPLGLQERGPSPPAARAS